MDIEIITEKLQFDIYGFGGFATGKDHTGTAFALSGKMWDVVKTNGIKNKGKNIWVYENADAVFAGIELEDHSGSSHFGLEKKTIVLNKYAWYKHIGPYQLIKQAGQNMRKVLHEKGLEVVMPYVEIYGHWNRDESRLETELFMCLK